MTLELKSEIKDLNTQIKDLEDLLTTAIEHGDIIEDQLAQNNTLLQQEVQNRRQAEGYLHKLVELITQQKSDLEVIIENVVDHSDSMDFEWLEQIEVAEHQSMTDSLTGIANRRAFDKYYMNEWKRAIRNESSISLIMLDVDHFKKFNDLNGHAEGDRCLKAITSICGESLDRPADLLTRYGGEEFAIILPDTNIFGAEKIAQQVINTIQNSRIIHGDSATSDYVTISLGVNSKNPSKDSDSSMFIQHTDQLLYQAKNNGRNQYITPNTKPSILPPTVMAYGDFTALHEYQRLENLSLSFIPSTRPITQRWRNNGLSADFLADYLSTFFPSEKPSLKISRKNKDIISAVSFISNELLENVMKYTAQKCELASGINLFLDQNELVFEAYNYVDEKGKVEFVNFINRIQNSDPGTMLLEQLEQNAINEESSGLGILTMINDYDASLAWKFINTNKNFTRVFTQVTLKT